MVNKESALDLLQCRIGQGRNPKQIEEKRVHEVKEIPCSSRRRQMLDARWNLTSRPQLYGDTQINRKELRCKS